MQPRRGKQQVGIVHNARGLLGMLGNSLHMLPPSRQTDEVILRQLRRPGDEIVGHTANGNP